MKNKNLYPVDITIEQTKNKITPKLLIKKSKNILEKIKFKNTFISGMSLIILSVFVPFSLYYLITGTILLILSLASLIRTKNKK